MQIDKMSQKEALEIAQVWKYPPPFDFYDMTADIEDYEEIISPAKRGEHYFSIKQEGELVAFFCIFIFENKSDEFEFGIGLRPDLTGQGLGLTYNQLVINYIRENYLVKKIWLSVADFNLRATKVYERAGFKYQYKKIQKTNGSEYSFTVMNLDISLEEEK